MYIYSIYIYILNKYYIYILYKCIYRKFYIYILSIFIYIYTYAYYNKWDTKRVLTRLVYNVWHAHPSI